VPSPADAALVLLAGVGAGAVNAVVGSGTLLTFPTLLLLGWPPLLANVSNNVGLVPGSLAAVAGYRRELAGQGPRLRRLVPASLVGGVAGAAALLLLPAAAFDAVVPGLVLFALVLVVAQPRLRAAVERRRDARPGRSAAAPGSAVPGLLLCSVVLASGVYGGYFGAGQGVLLVGILGVGIGDALQRTIATKNVLAALVNAVARLVLT
jgi:uncharacterized protein